MKKLKWLILCLVPFCFLSFSKESIAQSEADTVQIILHKLLFEHEKMPDEQFNTGQEQTFLQNYRGLNDVTFTVYDVTESFYQLRKEGVSIEEAQKEIANQGAVAGRQIEEQVTKKVGNEDGIAHFWLPKKDSQKRDSVYLFTETKTPTIVQEKATNLVLVLPLKDKDDQELSTIHLYPKNELQENTTFLEKKVAGKQKSFSIGELVTYSVTTRIPNAQSYQLKDRSDKNLILLPQTIVAQIDGTTLVEGVSFKKQANGFDMTLTNDLLKQSAGKQLTLTYQMRIGTDASPDKMLENTLTMETESQKYYRTAGVRTGGKRFCKVDSQDKTPLPGAVFRIKNSEGKYLHQTSQGIVWRTDRKNAYLLTSGQDGHFSIRGLKDGSYSLEEIKAPAGYIKSKNEITFMVKENSFQVDDQLVEPLEIINKEENQSSILPKTNDQSYIGLIIIGIGLVGIGGWQLKKRGAKNEKNK
ncbi:SpaH/EbpB family LPXTG-anchored major pilin [Enterococcus durans]|uniref:SpaH/EbpB family LPXTG-anchored major pilin n=1 Tax=Enterococcus TaxID=1350 RepID=UPI002890228A|nr:SpaH/EbpB family LPXTG-anchored major pilin [Enterococcus durans]MDT2837951.1 SpaH/EbpB family LPXTG-anchored major pilin [Enterococcus durans]